MNIVSRHTAVTVLLVFLAACKPGTPKEYVQPDDMEDFLVDYHMARAMANNTPGNPEYNWALYKAKLLEDYGFTEADLDSSLVYYYRRADRFEKIYQRVAERLEENAVAMGAEQGEISKYAMLTANGDTADIWTQGEEVLLMPVAPYNRLDFDYQADSTYRKGDSFLFQFMSDYVYQDGSREAVALVSVTYDNDSIVTRHANVSVSGHTQLRVGPIDSLGIRRVRGFILLGGANKRSTTVRMLFLHHLQLIRFHQQIKQEDLPNEKEINKADSISQDSVARRIQPSSDSVRNTEGNGGQHVSANPRTPVLRMDKRVRPVEAQR